MFGILASFINTLAKVVYSVFQTKLMIEAILFPVLKTRKR